MKFLYIKILQACNASCFMCNYAHSKDTYRMRIFEFEKLLNAGKEQGIEWIRFTGGEPLLHENIDQFIKMSDTAGIKTSVITNGILLEDKFDCLAENGLNQLIISIDDIYEKNDKLRGHEGLFKSDQYYLKKAKEAGILTRVNTVCGRHNYREILTLQTILEELDVNAWELTPIKLEKQMPYTKEEREELKEIIQQVYADDKKLKPLGKQWIMDIAEEVAFFEQNIMPHPVEQCNVVSAVRFYDGLKKRLYPCNMIPHRKNKNYIELDLDEDVDLNSDEMKQIVNDYKCTYFKTCNGCSISAATYQHEGGLNY